MKGRSVIVTASSAANEIEIIRRRAANQWTGAFDLSAAISISSGRRVCRCRLPGKERKKQRERERERETIGREKVADASQETDGANTSDVPKRTKRWDTLNILVNTYTCITLFILHIICN